MQHSSASGIWSSEEAMLGLRDLLTAALDRPQRVEWNGKRYVVFLDKEPAGKAIDALTRPGPLGDSDDLD